MTPDTRKIFPLPNSDTVTYIKPTITRPNIIAGDFSYYAGRDFESRVTHEKRPASIKANGANNFCVS